MEIEVFYFSGTGNSLSVAKDLATLVNGRLTSISSVVRRGDLVTTARTLVIVFPAYLAQRFGVPSMVEGFVRKISGLGSKTIYAVCTCGGFELVNAVPTLKNLGRIVRSAGGTLFAEFPIKLPMNNLTYPSPLIGQDQERMLAAAKRKILDIGARIEGGRTNPNRWRTGLLHALLSPIYHLLQGFYVDHVRTMAKEPQDSQLDYFDLIKLTDKSIRVEDRCDGCGLCAKVCPAGNIELSSSKPVFLHRCEMCLACDEWCPRRAIRHWCKTEGRDYRHPGVQVADMLRQARVGDTLSGAAAGSGATGPGCRPATS